MQKRNISSFINSIVNREANNSHRFQPLLRNSLAAAAYDSVWTLALAYDELVKKNMSVNIDNVNHEIRSISFQGLSVS